MIKKIIIIIIIIATLQAGCSLMIVSNSSGVHMTESPKLNPDVSSSSGIRYKSDGQTYFKDDMNIVDSIKIKN